MPYECGKGFLVKASCSYFEIELRILGAMCSIVRSPPALITLRTGTENLVRVEDKMDGAVYRSMLEENLLQSARDGVNGHLQKQDNGPMCTAKSTLEWFNTNGPVKAQTSIQFRIWGKI